MERKNARALWAKGLFFAVAALLLSLMICFTASAVEEEAQLVYEDGRPADGWHSGVVHFYAPAGYTISASENGNFDQETFFFDGSCSGAYEYYLRDAHGVITKKTVPLLLDNTAPTLPLTAADGFSVAVTDTTITVTLYPEAGWGDAGSGINLYRVVISTSNGQALSRVMVGNVQTFSGFDPNVAYTVTVTAVDRVSNSASLSTSEGAVITEKGDLANAEIWINGVSAYTATYTGLPICPEDVVVKIKGTGRVVPADQYILSYDNNVAIGDGARLIVTAKAGGNYRNAAETTFTIAYLVTDARAEVSFGSIGSDGWVGGSVTLTAPAGYGVSLSDGIPTGFLPAVPYAENLDGELTYYLQNAAGEIARVVLPLRLDVDAPTAESLVVTPSDDAATVTLEAADALSGVGSVTLHLNGIAYLPESDGRFLLNGLVSNTTYTFTVTVVDVAGNTYTTPTVEFTTSRVDFSNPKYTVTVTVNGAYTYNGTPHLPDMDAISVMLNGTALQKSDFQVLSVENNVNAGSATVTVGGVGNYSGTAVGHFVVEKAALTVRAKAQTVVYGCAILTTPDWVEIVGLAAADTLSCTLVRDGLQILVTDVVVTCGGRDVKDNYHLTTVAGDLTVTSSAPIILPDQDVSLDKVYDGTPAGVPAYEISGAYTGVVSVQYYKDRVASETLLSAAPILPGEYLAVVSVAATAENEAATSAPVAFTISPRPLTVTVKEQIIGFGGSISSMLDDVEITVGALLNGHAVSAVLLHTDDSAVTENGKVALQRITITDGEGRDISACYLVTSIPGRLMIKSGTLEGAKITVQGKYVYNGAPHVPSPESVIVLVNGVRLTADQYTFTATHNINAGNATLTVTGCGNYAGSATVTFYINKAVATLQGSADVYTGLVYNGKVQNPLSTLPVANTFVEYSGTRYGAYHANVQEALSAVPGTYTLYYRAAGDSNHVPSDPTYVTFTIAKANLSAGDLPVVSDACYGQRLEELTLRGGRVIFASADGKVAVAGTWSFADPARAAEPGMRYELRFTPTDSALYYDFSTLVSLNIISAPVIVTPRPNHTQQFPGGEVIVTTVIANGKNDSFASDLPDAVLTWQVGETGEPMPISDGRFTIPAELPKGTEILIRATTPAVEGKYNVGSGVCRVLVSDKLSVEIIGSDRTVISSDDSFDVSTLFAIDPHAGEAIYRIAGGTGIGTLSGTVLTVSKSGSFIIEVETAAVGSYSAGYATATLTIVLDVTAPVISGITDGEELFLTTTVTVTDETELNITLNGAPVIAPFILPGNCNATYVIVATDGAGHTTAVTVEMRAIEQLFAPLAALTEGNVKSKDLSVVEGVTAALASLPTETAPQTEQDEVAALLERCLALRERIAATEEALESLCQSSLTVDTVTSAALQALNAQKQIADTLLAGDNLTAEERQAVEEAVADIYSMQARLSAVSQVLQNVSTAENAYRQIPPTKEESDALKLLIGEGEALLAGKNLTDAERNELTALLASLGAMLEELDALGPDVERIVNAVNAYLIETVTSADRGDIEELMREIGMLLEGTLKETERVALSEAKQKAEALLQRITLAAAAITTSSVQSVAHVTAENVKKTNEAGLQAAKTDIANAYAAYPNNYTPVEVAAMLADMARIDAALDALNRVKNAESAIAALSDPATVVENDPAAIEAYAAVKDCYEALTDYEKTLIDAELRGKYASFGRALTNYRVVAGDGSIWVEKSERDIAFEITCSAQRFMGVYVDGVQVMPERYTVSAKERNTVVVLSHDYLETLSTDSHTVLFLFEDGDAVAGIIVEAKPASGWLWLLIVPVLLIVGAAAYVLKIYLDRRNEKSIG